MKCDCRYAQTDIAPAAADAFPQSAKERMPAAADSFRDDTCMADL